MLLVCILSINLDHQALLPVCHCAGWQDKLEHAKARHNSASIFIAQDRPGANNGAKQYRGFQSLLQFLQLAEAFTNPDSPPSLYELIPDLGRAVYMYFDADMSLPQGSALHSALASDLKASTIRVANAFLSALESFLCASDCGFKLQPGVNCQVSVHAVPWG